LEKKDSLREDFKNLFPKGFIATQIHVLYVNFVKFGQPEIGKVVRYLPDKKKLSRSPAVASERIAPKIGRFGALQPWSAANFIQICSLPVEL